MKITDNKEPQQLDIQRFYLPQDIMQVCPKCGHEQEWDDYLSYPNVHEETEINLYCSECECEWSERIVLTVNIELVEG